jgi:hypothetical protein
MPIDFSSKTTGEIENIVENYRDHGKTDTDAYIDALRELELRRGKGLDLQKTFDFVVAAAKAQRFVAYKDIADVNGFEWTKIHYQIGRHLYSLCEYAHRKGLPLLSAIVVNAEFIDTGEMKPESRSGLIESARMLGLLVGDEEDFVRSEQRRVFDWASGKGAA